MKTLLPAQCLLLLLLGWHFRHALNTDAVAYLRIASYYADGRFDLAVSGYWGPLLSWLLAGLFKFGFSPLPAARFAMGISALFFTFGAVVLFKSLKLSDRWLSAGTVLIALASSYWSVQFITPDLLLGGWTLLAISQVFVTGQNAALRAGLFWGMAYLTKAVAMPFGLLVIAGFSVLNYLLGREHRGSVLRGTSIMIGVFAVVAMPWVTALSLKYNTLTFSTTARISHALTGPNDMERYHPFARGFHTPETGRITSWEEPSRMTYNDWSPFEKNTYGKHQATIIARNLVTMLLLFTSLNLAWPVLVLAAMKTSELGQRRIDVLKLQWITAALLFVYLPFYVTLTEQRFFYIALPVFFGGLALVVENGVLKSFLDLRLSIGCGIAPLLAAVYLIGDSPKLAGEWAIELATKMRTAGLTGSIAGSANLPGGRTGLFVAFHLQQPWHGDKLSPSPEAISASGAKYFVVRRNSPIATQLATNVDFKNLDAVLSPGNTNAKDFPVQVYEILVTNR